MKQSNLNIGRRKKDGKILQYTCHCDAYNFPHRLGGVKCTLEDFVGREFMMNLGTAEPCLSCNSMVNHTCQVAEYKESPKYCAIIQQLEHDGDVKLV